MLAGCDKTTLATVEEQVGVEVVVCTEAAEVMRPCDNIVIKVLPTETGMVDAETILVLVEGIGSSA